MTSYTGYNENLLNIGFGKTMTDWAKLAGILACVALIGCTSDEEKIKKVIDEQIAKCKTSADTFVEVDVAGGKSLVLTEVCHLPLEGPVLVDEFHARANTGPFFWILGLDKELSVWVLNEVTYDPIIVAKREIESRNATPESLAKADSMLAEAEKALPDSSWVRLSRVENALRLRGMVRGKDTQNPAGLGDAQAVIDANLAWAKAKNPADAAKIQLAVIEHLDDYFRRLRSSAEGLGSRDDWYRASIEQAKKDKDVKTVTEYQAELDKILAERPAERKTLVERMGQIFDQTCAMIGDLKSDGIEDSELKKQVDARKSSAKCAPEDRPKVEDYE